MSINPTVPEGQKLGWKAQVPWDPAGYCYAFASESEEYQLNVNHCTASLTNSGTSITFIYCLLSDEIAQVICFRST